MLDALLLSLQVAALCTLIALPASVGLGWISARKRFPGKVLLEALVYLPLVLPPVVTGYALLWLFSPVGPLGDLGIAFSWKGAALASALVALPLGVRACRVAFEAVDPALEEAAMTLGARPRKVFWTITLRLAAPGVWAAAILCFGRSLGEFGATIAFVGNLAGETRTLPLALYSALQSPGAEAEARALAWVSAGLAVATVLASEWLARRASWRR
jgi:molybdate transport system permease protein